MRSVLPVLLLSSRTSLAASSKCYALSLSGGNDHGAWEAGVVKGLVNKMSSDERQWNVVTGISMGAVVASAMAQYDIGQEAAMADHVVDSMLSLSNTPGPRHVYQDWPLLVDPLEKTGEYNTSPEYATLKTILSNRSLGNRMFTIGATDDKSGKLTVWDQTSVLNADGTANVDQWATYLRASSSVPGTFESVQVDGDVYSDGSVTLGTDIFSAVTKCKQAGFAESDIVMDVVTSDSVALKPWDQAADNTTIQVGLRGLALQNYNQQMADIFDACEAYPDLTWRYYVQASNLPSNGLDFNETEMQEMVTVGMQAAADAQIGVHCSVVEANRRSNTVPKGKPVAAVTDKCYAMALSGGGDKGAWEAGVVQGLVQRLSAEERKWAVSTGISAGSIISAGMALFDIGDEEAMGEFLISSVLNFTNIPGPAKVYKEWPVEIVQLFTESGLFDTQPEYDTLFQMLSGSGHTLGNRAFVVGSTNDETGTLTLVDETSVRNADGSLDAVAWAKGIRASSAVPGAFQSVDLNGVVHSDGGCVMGVNIFSAVNRCKQSGYAESDIVVDVVSCSSETLKVWDETADDKTVEIKARADNVHQFELQMADLFDACQAYPAVNWRYYVAAGTLPSNGLTFNATQMEEMAQIGQQNAATATAGQMCAIAEAHRHSKTVPQALKTTSPSAVFI